MRWIGGALAVIALGFPASVAFAAGSAADPPADTQPDAAHVLGGVDMEQSRLVQASDADGLAALFHPSYKVHAPNGRVFDLTATLAMVRNGSLALERHVRTQERVLVVGTTGVVIGVDRLEKAPPLALNGERTRRYTNTYVFQDECWRLLARHFHFMP